ncbi:hypothetical protein TS85_00050 [Sphingomonas hengshuiensis]|uniref:Uncharacterized protein n=2 Tax=Sphingomonas hengshuiensis TaxID=1609977 RepID=A0A7U5BE01_9SPHN|nr:hypothetical protein TS85_00050 [Sphingomonas hengshuiensis]
MLPAGYLLKRVVPPAGWLVEAPNQVKDVCSVANCVNDNVVDVQEAWKHNTFGVANSPAVLWALAEEVGVDSSGAQLFYYAAYERELESDGWKFDATSWRPRSPVRSAGVEDAVESPADEGALSLVGYDVVVFGDYLEHSPLSCNSAASEAQVNEHCLFPSLERAVEAINSGTFGGGCEEGAYTVFAVYMVN